MEARKQSHFFADAASPRFTSIRLPWGGIGRSFVLGGLGNSADDENLDDAASAIHDCIPRFKKLICFLD
ncbi:uncharacterized protein J3R85_015225 [Psidium guajava]|nr:uncharacterized protein J3R85_015225 [Psidium guajava]